MTSSGSTNSGSRGQSLKDQNRWQLWLIIAANSVFLYTVIQANAIRLEGLRTGLAQIDKLVPAGLAILISTVLNNFISAENKARLVFLRVHNALPGHRAFSRYAVRDPRIDCNSLADALDRKFPTDPVEQNQLWYQLFKRVENKPAIAEMHREFLLLRDYAGLSFLFLVVCGAVGTYEISSVSARLVYLALLVLQFVFVRQSASNRGVRLVTTVLAYRLMEGWGGPHKRPTEIAQASKRPARNQTSRTLEQ